MSIDCAPARPATLPEIAERRAAMRPEAVAYRFLAEGEDETAWLTSAELAGRARGLALWLDGRCAPGERAVLAYHAGLDFAVAFLACLYARVVAVP